MKTVLLHFFACLLIVVQFDISYASKFNPSVKVRTQDVDPGTTTGSDNNPSNGESTASKSKKCAGRKCMPQPVPAPGSPDCKPRFDKDSCCPTWICASDDILVNRLFDKDNNWKVTPEQYQHNLFDIDQVEDDEHDDFPASTSQAPDSKKFEQYAEKGKLANTHNKNFLNRLQHDESGSNKHNSGPSIANNYADYKRRLNNGNKAGENI